MPIGPNTVQRVYRIAPQHCEPCITQAEPEQPPAHSISQPNSAHHNPLSHTHAKAPAVREARRGFQERGEHHPKGHHLEYSPSVQLPEPEAQ